VRAFKQLPYRNPSSQDSNAGEMTYNAWSLNGLSISDHIMYYSPDAASNMHLSGEVSGYGESGKESPTVSERCRVFITSSWFFHDFFIS
jgi:hypothetical protein